MKTELQERADILAVSLQRSIDAGFEVLRSIAQFYGSSAGVGRQDFQRFVQPALDRHPSIHALEWLPRLADHDRPALEAAVQAEGYPSFQITEQTADGAIERAGQRPEYFPVLYVEPLESNQPVLGFDLASDATRRSALQRAIDSGAIGISGRIELVQEAQKQFGVLVILPIYAGGSIPETLVERREQLRGCVLGVFRIADIVRAALPGLDLNHLDLYLYDRSDRPSNSFLAAYASQTKQVSASPTHETAGVEMTWRVPTRKRAANFCTRSFAIGDRQWSVLLQPTPAYVDHAELYEQSKLLADAATAEAQRLQRALKNLQQTQARWFREKQLITIGVGLALLVFGGANWVSYRSMARLIDSKAAAERSHTAIASLAKILAATTDADASTLTANRAANAPLEEVTRLRQTLAPNTNQQRRLARLEPLITQRLAQQVAVAPVSADRQLQQQIRQVVAEMEQTERSQLRYWQLRSTNSAREAIWINGTGIALSVALLVGVYYLLQRQMSERQEIEVALYQVNSQLETEVKERMAELEQTRELSDLKLRLFSMVSHEFRTPLSTILISTQSLANTGADWSEERKSKNLARIQAAAKTMAQLLTDILTLNRAEAGKLEFRPEPIDLDLFCQRLCDEIQAITGASHTLEFVHAGSCTEAQLDPKLLHAILSNLLTNAVKYSPLGSSIRLTLICTPTSAVFQVQDWGMGIPAEDQPQLYDAFYRGQNVGDVTGTGLGLAVVKTCVDRHNGSIAVESQVGTGTTFSVMLPLS